MKPTADSLFIILVKIALYLTMFADFSQQLFPSTGLIYLVLILMH